jgi:hypothetical protein
MSGSAEMTHRGNELFLGAGTASSLSDGELRERLNLGPPFRDARRGDATQVSRAAAAFLVEAVLLTLCDVGTRRARGHIAEQSPAQPTATAPAKKDGPEKPRRTLDLRILNARTHRPEPGVSIRVSIPARDEGKTDPDGRFRIVGTNQEFTGLVISIRKPGFVPVQVNSRPGQLAQSECPGSRPSSASAHDQARTGLNHRRDHPRRAGRADRRRAGQPGGREFGKWQAWRSAG